MRAILPYGFSLLLSCVLLTANAQTVGIVLSTGSLCGGNAQLTVNGAFYLRAAIAEPWGSQSNLMAMDSVFGPLRWTAGVYESINAASVFSPFTKVVFMEGSDAHGTSLNNFLTTNISLIENWVSGGGHLLLNAAPNVGGNINFGFGGVYLTYPVYNSDVFADVPGHAIFNGPFLPCSTSYNGGFYGHATVNGGGLQNLLSGANGPVLATKPFGTGMVYFGGMTTANWHTPAPEGQHFRQNILASLSGGTQWTNYLWSTGETSQSIYPPTQGIYSVTVSFPGGATASASFSLNGSFPAVSRCFSDPEGPFCPGQTITLYPSTEGKVWYLRGQAGEPYGNMENPQALDDVFGNGHWTMGYFENVAAAEVFSESARFVFLDGSNTSAIEMDTFISRNFVLMQDWVKAGGKIWINASPNEGSNQNWHFGGVNLGYPLVSNQATASDPMHPVFQGPFTPVSTTFVGIPVGRGGITGAGLIPFLNGNAGNVLSYKPWGLGAAWFGAMAAPHLQNPTLEARNFRRNLMQYVAGDFSTVAYQWSNGSTSANINVGTGLSQVYSVTMTGDDGCTATASFTVMPSALSIEASPAPPYCNGDTVNLRVKGSGKAFYLRSMAGEPFNSPSNVSAMNNIFGSGAWAMETFEAAFAPSIFTPSTGTVFMDGSDLGAVELDSFFTHNRVLIENWVSDGGILLLNASPSEGGNQSWGFGGLGLQYGPGTASTGAWAAQAGHAIFVGPFTPVTTSFNGNDFATAYLTGQGISTILEGNAGPVLAAKDWGQGTVCVGSITPHTLQTPLTEARNLRRNVLYYLKARFGGGFDYAWSNGDFGVETAVFTDGVYSLTATSSNGCTLSLDETVTYLAPPAPVIAFDSSFLSTTEFASYQWLLDSLPLVGADGQLLSPPQFGDYQVMVTDSNGCTGISPIFHYIPVGWAQPRAGYRVYPNPATSSFTVDGLVAGTRLTLFNPLGQPVMSALAEGQETTFSRQHLPSGMYWLEVLNGESRNVMKVLLW